MNLVINLKVLEAGFLRERKQKVECGPGGSFVDAILMVQFFAF